MHLSFRLITGGYMDIQLDQIQNKIYVIRGVQVMVDSDLAELYGVETRALNQSVRRNLKRFPDDFMFKLTKEEVGNRSNPLFLLKM